jgi:hypothetical protein
VITVVATGFGHREPRLSLVDKSRMRAEEAADDYVRPQVMRDEANGKGKPWSRAASREGSLEVPTFLRKQMD